MGLKDEYTVPNEVLMNVVKEMIEELEGNEVEHVKIFSEKRGDGTAKIRFEIDYLTEDEPLELRVVETGDTIQLKYDLD